MKTTRILIAALLFLGSASIVFAETIVIVADEWPPFNCTPDTAEEGYMVEVARAVFEPRGCRVAYKVLPWKRALHEARQGRVNGVIGASKTDADGFVFPDEELARNFLSFYVKKGNSWRFTGPNSLNAVTLGVAAGYDYRSWLNRYIDENSDNPDKIEIQHGQWPMQGNLKMLLTGRIDALVDNESSIRYVAGQMGVLDRIVPAGHGAEPSCCYIAFSPASPDAETYARMLSEGIVQLRKDGRLDRILARYGLKDWK